MFAFTSQLAPDVLILGAGFSRAVSEAMPLTDGLGDSVLQRLEPDRPKVGPFQDGYFEAWLSRIGEDQPDLSAAENLTNRALFQRCSDALAEILDECTQAVPDSSLTSSWMQRLLGVLHARQSAVITFNQDTLLERAIGLTELYSWDARFQIRIGQQTQASWHNAVEQRPPLLPGRFTETALPTFRLLKLHGSTNWYWRAGDQSGATVARWFLTGTVSAAEAFPDEASARRRAMPGRVPLIIPPTAAKSSYYQAPIITQIWQDARSALSQPGTRVALIGYSLPVTDLVTSGMLRETLFTERAAPVPLTVADLNTAPVTARLQKLGATPEQLTELSSVEAFVDDYEQRSATEFLDQLRAFTPDGDALLLVGSHTGVANKVLGFSHAANGDLILQVDDPPPQHSSTNLQADGALPAQSLRQLIDELRKGGVQRLAAAYPGDHPTRYIIAAAPYSMQYGAGNGQWQALIPSAPLR